MFVFSDGEFDDGIQFEGLVTNWSVEQCHDGSIAAPVDGDGKRA